MRWLAVVGLVLLVATAFGCKAEEEGPTATEPSLTVTATARIPPTGTPYPYPTPFVTVTPAPTPTPLPDPERTVEGTGAPAGCFPSSPNPSEAPVDLGEPTRYARGIYSIGRDGGGPTLLADNPGRGPVPPGAGPRSISIDQQGGRAVFLAEDSKLLVSDLQAATPPRLLATFRYISDFALAPDGRSVVVQGALEDLGDGFFHVDTADGSVETIPTTFEGPSLLAWSPSGDRLAAAGIVQQSRQPAVFILRPDGSDLIQVAEDWQALAWSPDGSRLALGGQGISLADVEGQARKVSDSAVPYWETALAWSPDGRCLAFATAGPKWEDPPSLRVLDVETGWEVFLAGNATHPAWSPDGTRIAFLRDGNLWVMNTDGSQQTRLTNPRQPFVQEPAWLPESSGLLFAFVPPMEESVYLINPDGSGEVNLADGNGPVFSHDGARIAFYGGGIFGGLGALVDIYVMDSDGRGPAKVADVSYGDVISHCARGSSGIVWSGDGWFLAYGGNVRGTEVAPSDGSAPATKVGGNGASWAPNGHRLAYSSCNPESGAQPSFNVSIFDMDTGQTSTLTDGEWPSWSPDGQRIAFLRDNTVRVINVDGSGERELAATQVYGSLTLVWSPDGTQLAVAASELYVVDMGSGESRKLADGAEGPSWSPDGAQLAFSSWDDPNSPETSRVYVVNADGSGEPRILTDGSSPSWSPDGSRIAFAR